MSKDLDNFTGADSDSFEKGIHLEGEGSWKPLYPEELNRPLRHIEIDYNFKVLSSTLAGYRVFPSGNTPSNHLSVEDFSNDANKILKLKKEGNDYYWTLEQISSSSGSNDGVSLPAYDSLNDKVLKVINGGLSWEQDNFEAAITNTGSLSDFPTYSTTQNDKVLKVKNGALSWEADLEGTSGVNLPSYTSTENGKVLKVVGGNLTWSDDLQGDSGVSLPDTTNQDGKVLKVVGGVLQWADDNYEADTDTISVKRIEVKSPSSGVYSFNEYGQNANIVLERGNAYIFDWSGATSHPFRIVSTTAGGYNSQNDLGQTENWIEYNDLEYKTTVAIPWNYNGANLYYICQAHPAMNGTINVVNSELPQYDTNLDGKVLRVTNGALSWEDSDQGPAGPEGSEGPQGPAGPEGSEGPQGPAGQNGTDGKSAYQIAVDDYGFDGTQQQWMDSLQGSTGQNGTDGKDGTNGTNGTNGLSAYEIALDTGLFDGTQEEWIASLQGSEGPQGPEGSEGPQGPPGPPGDPGLDANLPAGWENPPTYDTNQNGKVLKVVGGSLQWADDLDQYPDTLASLTTKLISDLDDVGGYAGKQGQYLQVTSNAKSTQWAPIDTTTNDVQFIQSDDDTIIEFGKIYLVADTAPGVPSEMLAPTLANSSNGKEFTVKYIGTAETGVEIDFDEQSYTVDNEPDISILPYESYTFVAWDGQLYIKSSHVLTQSVDQASGSGQ